MIRTLLLFVSLVLLVGCKDSSPRVGSPKEPVPPPDFKKEPLPKGETSPGP